MRLIDLTGKKFVRLTVICRTYSPDKNTRWKCRCICGTECVIAGSHLRSGQTQSCGCLQRERASESSFKHGEGATKKKTVEYNAWAHMNRRCYDVNNKDYNNYGGRGIIVYAEWRKSYAAFLAYVKRRPTPKHSLDRYPDPNGNYEPGNVALRERRY